ncbi:glucokinase regulatory protein isoform X2 [Coregonus clupeaformis]|uniref:glucokinase regulatory protein isoform X2 n=1 Tax=Coregonus clupeaformis TaxID=59861 RepID=UPI001BE10437|nr:glucokinase regulatory protein isoform X2 [Coregonus clupeaformis]
MAESDFSEISDTCQWELPDYEPWFPVSEKSNPLTRDIDKASPNHIVRLLAACDAQMFQKETGTTYQRLFSDSVVRTMLEVARTVEQILRDPEDSLVVLSGCGTSGRLAFHMATCFNRALRDMQQKTVYSYIIAGGDRALLTSQEAPEDDPKLGMLTLEKLCEGKRHVLFIGISCGLSAPFVAGQLDFCLKHPDIYTPVLVGFNPVTQARGETMPGYSLTFREVVQRMEEQRGQRAFIINPAVGPEAISGSSRMKGGSATKILLETVLTAAHTAAFTNTHVTHRVLLDRMREYERVHSITYSHSDQIATLLQTAGLSLQCGGRVCYLAWGSLGLVGLLDASECIPTFGADYEDIRGFISGGYQDMDNIEGDLTPLGPQFCIAHEDFVGLVLPTVSDRDTVLLLYTCHDNISDVEKMAHRVREKTSNLHTLYHGLEGDTAVDSIGLLCSSVLNMTWPSSSTVDGLLHMWELSSKLVLNAVSTGSHILKGKIYRNHMVDLQVTNSKLYHRAIHILQKLSGVSLTKCEEALLKAIYNVEQLPEVITSAGVTTHTLTASHRNKVVPLALVCLLIGCSLSEAESRLESHPVVRDAVEACLTSSPGYQTSTNH